MKGVKGGEERDGKVKIRSPSSTPALIIIGLTPHSQRQGVRHISAMFFPRSGTTAGGLSEARIRAWA